MIVSSLESNIFLFSAKSNKKQRNKNNAKLILKCENVTIFILLAKILV